MTNDGTTFNEAFHTLQIHKTQICWTFNLEIYSRMNTSFKCQKSIHQTIRSNQGTWLQ